MHRWRGVPAGVHSGVVRCWSVRHIRRRGGVRIGHGMRRGVGVRVDTERWVVGSTSAVFVVLH